MALGRVTLSLLNEFLDIFLVATVRVSGDGLNDPFGHSVLGYSPLIHLLGKSLGIVLGLMESLVMGSGF